MGWLGIVIYLEGGYRNIKIWLTLVVVSVDGVLGIARILEVMADHLEE
jgi:hypothetical protein